MSYSSSRYRPSGRQVAAPDDSRSRQSSHHDNPSRSSQPGGGRGYDNRARSFPADEYLGYSSDDDDFYRSSSGRAPSGSSHRDQGQGRNRGYDDYDDGYDGDSDRGYGRGPSTQSPAPRDDHHGGGRNHPSSSSSHRDQGRDQYHDQAREYYYPPGGGLSSSGRHHDSDRDYGRHSGPGPSSSSRHGDGDMRGGEPRASERDSRREIPFRYMSPFDAGFGGSRERGGGGGGGRSDPFGDDWDFPSRSGHRRSSGRDDGWFSDGESDWSDGFW